jgi:hypothetical protein
MKIKSCEIKFGARRQYPSCFCGTWAFWLKLGRGESRYYGEVQQGAGPSKRKRGRRGNLHAGVCLEETQNRLQQIRKECQARPHSTRHQRLLVEKGGKEHGPQVASAREVSARVRGELVRWSIAHDALPPGWPRPLPLITMPPPPSGWQAHPGL